MLWYHWGASIVSVCLRCGWSIGNVMERYFRYESAGDQYTGRVVSGLPVNSPEFSTLPAHFSNPDDPRLTLAVPSMFPNLYSVGHLADVLRLILASLVLHHDFLVKKLPSNHALFSTSLFRDIEMLAYLKSILVSGYDSPVMCASGIPPHVEVLRQLAESQSSISAIPGVVLAGVRQILGAAAGHITRETLEKTIENALAIFCQNSPLRILPLPMMSLLPSLQGASLRITGATNFISCQKVFECQA